jgi:DNA-binding MarR family transcriptional regulator
MEHSKINAQRLLHLFESMREMKPGAAMQRLSELNLSFSHIRALRALAQNQTLAMKDLAEELQLTPPSITALTRRLVQTGLVRRDADEVDSRVTLLSLTDEGRLLLRQLYEGQLQHMELLLHGLTPEEQEQFLHLMDRAVRALRAESGLVEQ